MNERIKLLADQCYVELELLDSYHFDKEKFAELIIKECITISEAHAKSLEAQPCDQEFEQYEDGIVSGIYEATAVIKEHFGVEE